MPPVLSKFESLPSEILDAIALEHVASTFLGPPAEILTLLLLSGTIRKSISLSNNPHLYSRIFRLKFDSCAAVRRLDNLNKYGNAHVLADELVRRCNGLKRLREDVYPRSSDRFPPVDSALRVDLWMAYLMFIESDGKNIKQLIHYAQMDRLSLKFVTPGGRFHDGTEANRGWTVDNEVNALIAWIFQFTDELRLQSETLSQRRKIIKVFAHFFVGTFKYDSAYAPITSVVPLMTPLADNLVGIVAQPQPNHPAFAMSLAASPLSRKCTIPVHFGAKLTLNFPLLTPAAFLICAVRFETTTAEAKLPLPPGVPETRAEAIALQWDGPGPTRREHDEQNRVTTKCINWDSEDTGSDMHEHDWRRISMCYEPRSSAGMRNRAFTPGILDGIWVGRFFEIPFHDFTSNLYPNANTQANRARRTSLIHTYPMQFRIREHHQCEPKNIVPVNDISTDGTGKGVFNAWLPENTISAEINGNLHVNSSEAGIVSYKTHHPVATQAHLDEEPPAENEDESPFGNDVWDILITAKTDDSFGTAWGHQTYYGRVRALDGLIVLVRDSEEVERRWIFRGYLHGKQNLVGRWRETNTPIDLVGWEGVWSMTKEEER